LSLLRRRAVPTLAATTAAVGHQRAMLVTPAAPELTNNGRWRHNYDGISTGDMCACSARV